MKKVNEEGPKDGNKEDYIDFLQKKQQEFNQHITTELEKVLKQKKDSKIVKAKCFGVL
jgi:ABC-type nickel/cobalt efflux system permease component RcnA